MLFTKQPHNVVAHEPVTARVLGKRGTVPSMVLENVGPITSKICPCLKTQAVVLQLVPGKAETKSKACCENACLMQWSTIKKPHRCVWGLTRFNWLLFLRIP